MSQPSGQPLNSTVSTPPETTMGSPILKPTEKGKNTQPH